MKNVAIIAVLLGLLGSAANAESAINPSANLTLAFNSTPVEPWVQTTPVKSADIVIREIETEALTDMLEQVSEKLNKQLEDKIAKEFDYAMQ